MKRNMQGFTLTELTIVLSIISIMVAISVPAIVKSIPDYRLKKAAYALFSDLQLAKSTAVLTKEKIRVIFNSDKETYSIESISADNTINNNNDTIGTTIKNVSLASYGSGVRFGSGSATKSVKGRPIPSDFISYKNNNSVKFGINGMVNSLGYVYLTNTNNKLCYSVATPTNAGIIQIYKTSGTTNKWVSD